MNLKGFIRHVYGTDPRFFMRIAAGKKNPPKALLLALNNAHVRLFPTEPVLVTIPNYPVAIPLGVQPSEN